MSKLDAFISQILLRMGQVLRMGQCCFMLYKFRTVHAYQTFYGTFLSWYRCTLKLLLKSVLAVFYIF